MRPMSHIMVVGPSLSGKSVAVKDITRNVKRDVLVFDRQSVREGRGVNGWPRALVFKSWEKFVRAVKQKRGCVVVIDDAAKVFRDKAQRTDALWMLEEGRHLGHMCIVIAQRYTGIDKTARENCDDVIVFKCNQQDADELAAMFAQPGLSQATKLGRYEFLHATPYEAPKKGMAKYRG